MLELLVVLSLVALTVSAVLPATVRWIDSVEERGWRADLRAELEALPLRAFGSGQALEVDAVALRARVPGLPAAVEIRLPQPLRFSAQGQAQGGVVELRRAAPSNGRVANEVWRVEPISGRVQN